jgi:hypothetical protein
LNNIEELLPSDRYVVLFFVFLFFIGNSFKLQGNLTKTDDLTIQNDVHSTPIYLAAFAANNLPGETWGPRRRADQNGVYEHLRNRSNNNKTTVQQHYSDGSSTLMDGTHTIREIANPTFQPDSTANYDDEQNQNQRF